MSIAGRVTTGFIVLLLLCVGSPAWAAVSLVSSAEFTQTTLASSKTQSVTVSSGTNRCLVIPVALETDGRTVSGITFNTSENFVKKSDHTFATPTPDQRIEFWYLVAPTETTANVVVSIGGGTAIFAGAIFYVTGCNQTTPLGTAVTSTGSGANASVSVTDGATGDLVIDIIQDEGGDADPPGAGQTQVGYTILTVYGVGESSEAGGASVTMSWTNSAFNRHLAAINIFQQSAVVTGCLMRQNIADNLLLQNGTDGFLLQGGGGTCGGGSGPVPAGFKQRKYDQFMLEPS